MSNFMKQGLRQAVVTKNKEVKKHIKAFYGIIGEIDNLSKQLDPSIKYNEENINDYVRHMLGRDLDSMEQFLLLGKLNVVNNTEVKDEVEDNN